MKNPINRMVVALFAITAFMVACCDLTAQTLTIKGNVTLDEVSSLETYTVKVLDLNTETVTEFQASKAFSHNLPFNGIYTVIVSKEGYEPKSIYINTSTDSEECMKFKFDMNLNRERAMDNVVYQAGGLFYNKDKERFDYYYCEQ